MAARVLPEFLPGTRNSVCSMCGASKRETDNWVVDLGVDIEFEGWFALCQACATEVANAIGCYHNDEVQRLRDLIARQEQRLIEADKTRARMEEVVSV